MKWKKDNKYIKSGLTLFFALCAVIIFYYILFHGENLLGNIYFVLSILSPILYGVGIAYLLSPMLNFIHYKVLSPFFSLCKWKKSNARENITRYFSVFLSLIIIIGLIAALITMIVVEIIPSIISIADNTDTYISNMSAWLDKVMDDNPVIKEYVFKAIQKYSLEIENLLNEFIIQKSSDVIRTLSISVINVFRVFWNIILGIIISVYLMAGKEHFAGEAKRSIYALFSEKSANILLNNFKFAHKTFSGFISGKVFDSIVIGILCFIGTSILRTPYAMLVSVIIGVTNIIPFFGPFLGAIPSAILIILVDPMHLSNLVYFIIFVLILQQIDGNIIGPKILGGSTGLTGFWVIFSLTVFGGLMGVFGILVGVPLFAVIFAAIKSYIDMKLSKKNLELDGDKYIYTNGIIDGVYSYFTPDYMISRRKSKKNSNTIINKENLLKQYGMKYLCEFNRDTLLNQVEDNTESFTGTVSSTDSIIADETEINQ